jgi:hypothetical protein
MPIARLSEPNDERDASLTPPVKGRRLERIRVHITPTFTSSEALGSAGGFAFVRTKKAPAQCRGLLRIGRSLIDRRRFLRPRAADGRARPPLRQRGVFACSRRWRRANPRKAFAHQLVAEARLCSAASPPAPPR